MPQQAGALTSPQKLNQTPGSRLLRVLSSYATKQGRAMPSASSAWMLPAVRHPPAAPPASAFCAQRALASEQAPTAAAWERSTCDTSGLDAAAAERLSHDPLYAFSATTVERTPAATGTAALAASGAGGSASDAAQAILEYARLVDAAAAPQAEQRLRQGRRGSGGGDDEVVVLSELASLLAPACTNPSTNKQPLPSPLSDADVLQLLAAVTRLPAAPSGSGQPCARSSGAGSLAASSGGADANYARVAYAYAALRHAEEGHGLQARSVRSADCEPVLPAQVMYEYAQL